MTENRQTAGAIVGLVGAQVSVLGAFYLFGEQCCADQFCINDESRCLFGLELFAYWASVGSVATLLFAGIGAVIGGDL